MPIITGDRTSPGREAGNGDERLLEQDIQHGCGRDAGASDVDVGVVVVMVVVMVTVCRWLTAQ